MGGTRGQRRVSWGEMSQVVCRWIWSVEREIGTDGSGGGRMAERAVRSYGNIVRENMCRRWRWSDSKDFDLCVRYSI